MSKNVRKRRIALSALCGVCCLLMIIGVIRILPYLGKLGVAAHQQSTTREIAAWGRDYSQIFTEHDAARAKEMIGYIETYYVPSDGGLLPKS